MKIGMTESSYRQYGDARFSIMREHGYEAVDYSMSDTENALYALSDEDFAEKLRQERYLAEKAGLMIFQVHGPWRWPVQDSAEEERAERMEKMKRSIRGTAILGCRYWVIHPIMPYGEKDAGFGDETRQMNLTFMRELLKTAEEVDVVICLENMPMRGLSLGGPETVMDFVKEMDSAHFKMCLDLGHMTLFKGESAGDFVRKYADMIPVFHIHDSNGWADLHQMPYYGITDWGDFGKALREVDYRGVFSLEVTLPQKLPRAMFEKTSKLMCEIARCVIDGRPNEL